MEPENPAANILIFLSLRVPLFFLFIDFQCSPKREVENGFDTAKGRKQKAKFGNLFLFEGVRITYFLPRTLYELVSHERAARQSL